MHSCLFVDHVILLKLAVVTHHERSWYLSAIHDLTKTSGGLD
jgi:hypothetical protein